LENVFIVQDMRSVGESDVSKDSDPHVGKHREESAQGDDLAHPRVVPIVELPVNPWDVDLVHVGEDNKGH
jgi:hypothetical protein